MSKILFWSAGDDGSSWYRCDLPSEALRWSGHNTLVTQQVNRDILEEADVIVGSRIATPGALGLWLEMATQPREDRALMVVDLDDAYFALDPSNPAASHWDAAQLERLATAIAAADLVTVASQGLAEHLERRVPAALQLGLQPGTASKVKVVPNGLHAGWLSTPRAYEAHSKENPLRVGWAGTASSARDFDLVARSLSKIVEYGDGSVKLRLVGMPRDHPGVEMLRFMIPQRLHEMVEAVEWMPHGQQYLSACADFDIWVYPLRPDEFATSKFPTKALEAGFFGIPLIASDIRPYREWDDDPNSGVALVDGDKPWLWGRHLKELVDSPQLRRTMGEAARSRAARNITQVIGQQWANTLGVDAFL